MCVSIEYLKAGTTFVNAAKAFHGAEFNSWNRAALTTHVLASECGARSRVAIPTSIDEATDHSGAMLR